MDIRPDRSAGVAVWRQIADALRADLAIGAFPPGGRLPTEAALSARFGVNRHTVRRALAVLAAEGLVRAERGRGVFARPARLDYPIGPRTRFSEIVAGQHREPGGRLIGWAEEPANLRLAAELGVGPGTRLLRLETLREADATPIGVATAWLEAARVPALVAAHERTGSVTAALAACGIPDYRRRTTRAVAEAAGTEDAGWLGVAPGAPLLVTESLNVTADGRPLQFARARFAADRVQLVVGS
jgi:GntR family phosphonate transport system transcriptional regulator